MWRPAPVADRKTVSFLCFSGIIFLLLLIPLRVQAVEEEGKKEIVVPRGKEGVVVTNGLRLDIPPDQKLFQVADNQIRVEDKNEYLLRKFGSLDQKVEKLEERLDGIEKRLKELEKAKP